MTLMRLLRGLESLGIIIGREGLALEEFQESPSLVLHGSTLTISASHSMRNSAKETYKFEVTQEGGAYLVRGYQKLMTRSFGKPYEQSITLQPPPAADAQFFWVDPDGTRHALSVNR